MSLLNYRDISKRKICTNSIDNNIDSYSRYKKCKSYLERVINTNINENNIDYNIFNEYLNSLKDVKEASKNFSKPLNLVSICNDNDFTKISNKIFNEYTNDICYYIEDITHINSSLIDRYNLTEAQYDKLNEIANKIIVSDRILKNHSIISERFKINDYFKEVPYKGLEKVLEAVCPLIDTFNIPDYQRYSATIEECWYVLESNHIVYSKSELVSLITEYYMLASSNLEPTSKKGFRTALNKSALLEDADCCKVEYITNPDSVDSRPQVIRDYITKYISSNTKDISLLHSISIDAINNVSNDNFIKELYKILVLYFKTGKFETFEDFTYENVLSSFKVISDNILYNVENRNLTKEQILMVYESICRFSKLIVIGGNVSESEVSFLSKFKGLLDDLSERVYDFANIVYYESNLDIINQINETNDIISLDEFKIFKFHNLIAAAFRADKYLKNKAKKSMNKVKGKVKKFFKKAKDILFPEGADVNYILNNNGIAEVCIAQYEYDSSYVSEMHEFLNETCKELNQQTVFDKYDEGKFYYIINPSMAEIRLASTSRVSLTNEEALEVEKEYSNTDDAYIENFANLINYVDILESISIDDLLFRINETKNNLNSEELNVALEALEIFGINLDAVQESFGSSIKSDNENEFYSIDIKLEAYDIFDAIMEKGAPSVKKPSVGPAGKSDNSSNNNSNNNEVDKDDEEAKKNKFSGINFNKIKLALLGLKAKGKDLGQKEKELSRNLDGTVTRFIKSMKNAMVSDSREAIIKGQVIPSFSKCIKLGIALAGSFVISGFNPVVPLIGAIGAFAISKNMTRKERILLLDEIETEIEVLDKEIQIAESNNKMKRLRALLKQKKELQRQYQRIKYNIRVGKDILPGSSVGVPNNND